MKFEILHEAKNPSEISYSIIEEENKIKLVEQIFINDIIPIADKGKTWNEYLQVSIIKITKEDFDTICEAIKRN